jgi:hypothetical protein
LGIVGWQIDRRPARLNTIALASLPGELRTEGTPTPPSREEAAAHAVMD